MNISESDTFVKIAKNALILILDDILAASDVWLIGDSFLRSIFPALQALRAKAVLDKRAKPYIYEFYNVIPRYSALNSNIRSVLARIFNELVTALNERPRIPRYIFMILDREILEVADHNNFGIYQIITELIDWLARNIDKTIDLRREDVRQKRPGAIASSGEPRIIWTKMVIRPMIQDPVKGFLFAQCKKLNEAITDTVMKYKHSHIMDVSVPADDHRLFDKWGNLSGIEMDKYWSNLIMQLKQFDRAEIDLRPAGKTIPTPSKPTHGGKSVKKGNYK